MKLLTELYQILLELREILDRYDNYGYWIDPQNRLIPVDYQAHTDAIKETIPPPSGYDSWDTYKSSGGRIYKYVYNNGFIRIEHSSPEKINIQGIKRFIKRAKSIIKPSISQPDVSLIRIDQVKPGSELVEKSYKFRMPTDRQQAMEFFS